LYGGLKLGQLTVKFVGFVDTGTVFMSMLFDGGLSQEIKPKQLHREQ
jgi:hypothetical protein